MVEVNWTHEAEVWLRDIYSYIAIDNRDAAQHTIAGIFEKVQLLKRHPRLGYRYETENLAKFASSSTAIIGLLI